MGMEAVFLSQRSDDMATISGYDSASIGVLFSSLNQSRSNNSTSLLGGSADILGINYADYATIRSGSYFKLLNAYYGKGSTSEEAGSVLSTSTAKDDTKTLARIEDAAGEMKESAAALMTSGSKSVFEKVTTTDKEGVTKTDYDTDAIYKAVKAFADDYNDLLDEAVESDTTSILRAARNMVNYTKVNERMLSKMGITIGEDNKLEVDEKAFKEADMDKVKSLFGTRGSYGYQIQTQASLIESYAKNEAAKSNTYGKNGVYTYNYNTGELYNSVV